jgi:hypothetical protein
MPSLRLFSRTFSRRLDLAGPLIRSRPAGVDLRADPARAAPLAKEER